MVAALANPDQAFRPGSFVTAEIPLSKDDAEVLVPKAALQTIKGDRVVFVRNDQGFEARKVTIGREDDRNVEIVSGLSAGEAIAVSNTFTLKAELGKAEAEHQRLGAMISRIIEFSIRRRWLVVLACFIASALGVWSLARIPIDAVPDITNNQVQINTVAPALSPVEIEKQVTFRIETALAGTPGLEYTRSLSRNGFSQVTAVFGDKTNIYFARQQINERLLEVRSSLPPGAEPRIGPVSTGLGEIYMWTVEYRPPTAGAVKEGQPGWQSDGAYLTPDGQRLTSELERAAYLRTVQDWIIRPQLKGVPGVAGVDAIGGYVKQYQVQPDPSKLIALGLSFGDIARAIEANNLSRGATTIEQNGEGYVVRATGRVETADEIADIAVVNSRKHPGPRQGYRRGQDRRSDAHRQRE